MGTLPPVMVNVLGLVILVLVAQVFIGVVRRQVGRAVSSLVLVVLVGLVPAFLNFTAKWNPPAMLVLAFAAMFPVLAIVAIVTFVARVLR